MKTQWLLFHHIEQYLRSASRIVDWTREKKPPLAIDDQWSAVVSHASSAHDGDCRWEHSKPQQQPRPHLKRFLSRHPNTKQQIFLQSSHSLQYVFILHKILSVWRNKLVFIQRKLKSVSFGRRKMYLMLRIWRTLKIEFSSVKWKVVGGEELAVVSIVHRQIGLQVFLTSESLKIHGNLYLCEHPFPFTIFSIFHIFNKIDRGIDE